MNLIESYEEYKLNPQLKDEYECIDGKIRYYNDEPFPSTSIAIHLIIVKPELERTGIFTALIKHIIDDKYFQKICILAPSSHAMHTFLNNFEYKGMKFNFTSDASLTIQ